VIPFALASERWEAKQVEARRGSITFSDTGRDGEAFARLEFPMAAAFWNQYDTQQPNRLSASARRSSSRRWPRSTTRR